MLRSAQLAKDAQEKLAALPTSAAEVECAVTAANALLLQAAVSSPDELSQSSDAMISALAAARDRAMTMERALAEASAKVLVCVASHHALHQCTALYLLRQCAALPLLRQFTALSAAANSLHYLALRQCTALYLFIANARHYLLPTSQPTQFARNVSIFFIVMIVTEFMWLFFFSLSL